MVRITENTFNLIFTIFNTVHLFRSRFLSGIILLFVELPLILLVLAGLLAVISVNFCLMRNLFCIHFRSYFCVGIGFWVFLFLSALSEISFNCLLTCIVFCMKSAVIIFFFILTCFLPPSKGPQRLLIGRVRESSPEREVGAGSRCCPLCAVWSGQAWHEL